MPPVPADASAMACSAIAAMPSRSMSFIVKTCTPDARISILLALVEIPDPDEHRVLREHRRRCPIDGELGGS